MRSSAPDAEPAATTGANGINQIAYTWQLGNGITLNVGADERRVQVDRQPVGVNATSRSAPIRPAPRTAAPHPDPWVSLRVSQAWGRASVAVIGHHNAATYYTGTVGGLRAARRPAPRCAAIRTTSGAGRSSPAPRSSSTSLSPGSRFGVYVNYGVGASAYQRRQQPDEPGPVRLRQPGCVRRA